MSYAFTPFSIPYILAFVLAGFISIYSFVFFERKRTNLLFVGLSTSITIWIFGYLFVIFATTLELMKFWEYIRYIGINLTPVFFLLLAISFSSFAPKIFAKPLNIVVLFIPAVIDYILLLTNDTHHLYFESLSEHSSSPFVSLYRDYGIFFLLHTVIMALFLGVGIIALVLIYRRTNQQTFQRQIQLILLAAFFFILVIIIYQFRILPITEYLDITPLGFIVAGPIFIYGMRQYHLIDIVPLAHRVIISNLTNTGIIATDLMNRIIEFNPKAREYLLSDPDQDIIGDDLFSVLYSQKHLTSHILKQIKELESIYSELEENRVVSKSYEIQLITSPDFEHKYLRVFIEKLQENSRPVGTILFLLDITAEKEIQKVAQRREDLRDSLLGVISHDLKNDLFVISGLTDLIREKMQEHTFPKELFEFLAGIDVKVNEAAEIISNVRDYLKSLGSFDQSINFNRINLKEVLDSVIESSKEIIDRKHLSIDLDSFSEEIYSLADLRIRSVFTNLLDNAIKWSPNRGSIKVSLWEEDYHNMFSICDEGVGVPDGLKEAIFKPFTAFGDEKLAGSGLGLALASEILHSYNGEIWVSDNSPSGACFHIKIPKLTKAIESL